ncbi:MAG: hypothetical protein IPN74_19885 [Haliscomenobacter sp.]|nr:hypothetical protein [Haliscomenobacter sp.]MBK8880681.1 hypothetical protein [Haliscomenobacter sp.]
MKPYIKQFRLWAGFAFLAVLFSLSTTAGAQTQRIVHSAFVWPDSARQLTVDIPWAYSTASWVNNSILVEMTIRLENGSDPLLKSALGNGRYALTLESGRDSCRLTNNPKSLLPLQTSRGKVLEQLTIKIFLPEKLIAQGANRWVLEEKNPN